MAQTAQKKEARLDPLQQTGERLQSTSTTIIASKRDHVIISFFGFANGAKWLAVFGARKESDWNDQIACLY